MILACILITGCNVKENLDDCDVELELAFRFMKGGTDQFGTEVSSLDVFIFDSDGQFIRRLVDTDRSKFNENYRMRTTLPPGQYNFITWGGLSSSSAQYTYPKTALEFQGATFAEEMTAADVQAIDKAGVMDYRPSDMFYGNRLDITLVMEKRKETIVTDLVKNSTQINLKIDGLPASMLNQLDISFYAANGTYNYFNQIDFANPGATLKYNALDATINANDIYNSSFYTFRLVFDKENTLILWDKSKNEAFDIADVLNDFIRKDPNYNTQAKVDAEDVFYIELTYAAYVRVAAKVNGWDVQTSNPGPIY